MIKSTIEVFHTGLYDNLRQEASNELGSNAGKGLIGRYIAKRIMEMIESHPNIIPNIIDEIVERIRKLEVVETLKARDDEHDGISF